MGVEIYNSTMDGALTPTCNKCGVSLCWDIDELEYKTYKDFWDDWICKECNNGVTFNKQFYKRKLTCQA